MLLELFNKELIYHKQYESFCLQNCINQVLGYYGVNNASLYINSALSLIFKPDEKSEFGYTVKYDNNFRDVLPEFCPKLYFYQYQSDESGLDVWNSIKIKIDEGIPIIAGVDIYYLNYQLHYNKNHGNHNVIVCGYSDSDESVSIIDWYEPWFFKGNMGLNDFLKARSSDCPWDGGAFSGIPVANFWCEIERDGWDCPSSALIDKTISLTLEQYYCEDKGNDGSVRGVTGLIAMRDLIENYRGSSDFKNFMEHLFYDLYVLLRRKKMFELYLELSYQYTNLEPIYKALSKLKLITKQWELLQKLALKCGFVNSEYNYNNMLTLYKEVISLEIDFQNDLLKIKNAL